MASILTVLLASAVALQDPSTEMGVRARVWVARYSGSISAGGSADNGTPLDAASDLGMDDFEAVPEFQAWLDAPGLPRFQLGYWRFRTEGSSTLHEDAVFDGRPYPAGTDVDSKLGLDVYSLDAEFPVLRETVQLGLIAGFRYFTGDLDLRGGGGTEHTNLNRPLLLPGLQARIPATPWCQVEGRIEGIALTAHNLKVRYAELEAEVTFVPFERLSVGVGYRHYITYFKALKDSVNFNLDGQIAGPMVSVAWTF